MGIIFYVNFWKKMSQWFCRSCNSKDCFIFVLTLKMSLCWKIWVIIVDSRFLVNTFFACLAASRSRSSAHDVWIRSWEWSRPAWGRFSCALTGVPGTARTGVAARTSLSATSKPISTTGTCPVPFSPLMSRWNLRECPYVQKQTIPDQTSPFRRTWDSDRRLYKVPALGLTW